MTNALAHPAIVRLTSLVAGAQRLLPPGPQRAAIGAIVRVIGDGTIGEVVRSLPTEVEIVHGDFHFGRGPWVMLRDQVEVASEADRDAYLRRCVDRFIHCLVR